MRERPIAVTESIEDRWWLDRHENLRAGLGFVAYRASDPPFTGRVPDFTIVAVGHELPESSDGAYGRLGAITDDTQMTLFTAEGILRGHNRSMAKGIASASSVVRLAYKRWLHTQGYAVPEADRLGSSWPDGWLIGQGELHARRAPGNTCLSALADERHGSIKSRSTTARAAAR